MTINIPQTVAVVNEYENANGWCGCSEAPEALRCADALIATLLDALRMAEIVVFNRHQETKDAIDTALSTAATYGYSSGE